MKIFFKIFLFVLPLVSSLPANEWQTFLKDKILKNEIPLWMIRQVEKDFEPFKETGISRFDLEVIMQNNTPNNSYLLVRYEIKNGKILVKYNEGLENHLRQQIVTRALVSLSEVINLPDCEFIISLHDACGYVGDIRDFNGPVLTFAKSVTDFHSIMIPDFEALEGYSKLLDEVKQANRRFPWKRKRAQAFWRGNSTGGALNLHNYFTFPRVQLVALSLKYPKFLDARFTGLVQLEDKGTAELLMQQGYMGDYFSPLNHIQYKYQILVDGNTCAYSRAIWELFSNAVIFKHESPNIQWYYNELKPYVHYIPVANDFHDLIEKIGWAMNHDLEIQQIVKNANDFAINNLKHEDVMLYFYLVLDKYIKLYVQ